MAVALDMDRVASFTQFAEEWQRSVLPNLKPSTQSPVRSQLRKHLLPTLGTVAMKNITAELLQSLVSDCDLNPKTIKNLVATMRIMWKSARTWNYVGHDPFDGLVLPQWETAEQPVFSRDHVQQILAKVDPYYWPVLWLVIQTGIRRGEVCALNVRNVDFDRCFVEVRRSRFAKHITNTKA